MKRDALLVLSLACLLARVAGEGAAASIGCNCILVYKPVCGRDGKVYGNACQAECAGTTSRFECTTGAFRRFNCEADCKAAAQPGCACDGARNARVCGKSGAVYSNACLAGCAKDEVRFACAGRANCNIACRKAATCVCPEYYSPVCGADGKMYDNPCFAKCTTTVIDRCPLEWSQGRCRRYCASLVA